MEHRPAKEFCHLNKYNVFGNILSCVGISTCDKCKVLVRRKQLIYLPCVNYIKILVLFCVYIIVKLVWLLFYNYATKGEIGTIIKFKIIMT